MVERGESFKISPTTRDAHHTLLVGGINDNVHRDDTLWVLGDFAWGDKATREFRDRIRCRDVRLLRGNHDCATAEDVFQGVHDLLDIDLPLPHQSGHQKVVLCHYPMRSWHKSHQGSWQLFGHVHGNIVVESHQLQLDVGVDTHAFRPWSWPEVVSHMQLKMLAWHAWKGQHIRKAKERGGMAPGTNAW